MTEIITGIISSLIYDSLKMGCKYISRNFFEEEISMHDDFITISHSQMDQLYDIINNIFFEVKCMHEKYASREELNELIRMHIEKNSPENQEKNLRFYIEEGDGRYKNEIYDSAINSYNNALYYVEKNDKELEALIRWKIFLCHLKIEEYYKFAVECNGKCYDLMKLYNDNDYDEKRTISDIKKLFEIRKFEATSVFLMLSGKDCTLAKRKYVIPQNAYDIGCQAYHLSPNDEWAEILNNCVMQ